MTWLEVGPGSGISKFEPWPARDRLWPGPRPARSIPDSESEFNPVLLRLAPRKPSTQNPRNLTQNLVYKVDLPSTLHCPSLTETQTSQIQLLTKVIEDQQT